MSDYHFSGDAWLVKTDALGKMLWNQTYGGDDMDEACSLVACSDGGYTIAGGTRDLRVESDLYYSDIWLIKTDEFGIVPEFPAWIMLPSIMILTLTASILFRRRERT